MVDNKVNTDKMSDYEVWKILIIDDDNFVHLMIKEKLKDFTFEGKDLYIMDAYTSTEALKILSKNKDVALILLDVYLSDETTGLKLSKYIREIIGNSLVRIIMMTSSNSNTLQEDAILNYDINGYEEKAELLSTKLYTVVVSSLRYYRDILHMANNKKAMEKIVSSSSKLFNINSINDFLISAMYNLNSIVNYYGENNLNNANGIAAIRLEYNNEFCVVSGFGRYKDSSNKNLKDILNKKDLTLLEKAYEKEGYIIVGNKYISTYSSTSGVYAIVIFDVNSSKKNYVDFELLDVFHKNIAASFETLCMNKEIEETQKEILYILGEVTEARSEETGNHVKRVSKYAKILAEKIGLSSREISLVTSASPIHDIGKVAIPDKILLKPSKLTTSEFEIVKKHTTIGYNILKNSNRDVLKSAAIIAHEHHEKYDGTGYPRGLKGKEIHIFGRIVGVADVFDALGSPRVYKKPWVINDILEYFKEERGKHFDPKLVDILFDSLDEFLEIKEKYSDENTKVLKQTSDNSIE